VSLAQTLSLVKLSPEFFFCQTRLTLLNACYRSRYYAWLGTNAYPSSVRPCGNPVPLWTFAASARATIR